mmetsp:Transcript_44644/g.136180  ORF Transcript_44644/g.136180 Transcript_44644/m.136180 type:complete len:192 (+) Transcript_44644:281-856(+)
MLLNSMESERLDSTLHSLIEALTIQIGYDSVTIISGTNTKKATRTFTKLGFERGRLPDDLFASMSAYYYNNKDYHALEEKYQSRFINWWEKDVFLIQAPIDLKLEWQNRIKVIILIVTSCAEGPQNLHRDHYSIMTNFNIPVRLLFSRTWWRNGQVSSSRTLPCMAFGDTRRALDSSPTSIGSTLMRQVSS